MAPSKREVARRAKEAFGPFLKLGAWVRKNPRRALQQPRTTLERLRGEGEAVGHTMTQEEWKDTLCRMFEALPAESDEAIVAKVREAVAKERAELQAIPLGANLLELYDRAEANGPVSPLLIVNRPPASEAPDALHAAQKLLAAAGARRGERKAGALLDAVPAVVDFYEHYVRMVWTLAFLSEGRWPSRLPGNLGARVQQAAARTAPLELVDPSVAHVRNAVAHNHAHYRPATRDVHLRDDRAGWEESLPLSDLGLWIDALWRVAGPIRGQLRSIAFWEILLKAGVYESWSLLGGALRDDPAAIAALKGVDIDGKMTRLLVRAPRPDDADLLWFLSEPEPLKTATT